MLEKKRLIEKARKLGREYLSKYPGCAPTTLLAVADTLNQEVSDDLFKAMIGLSSMTGGCGGICGVAAAIGLKYGLNRQDFVKTPVMKIFRTVLKVREKFVEEYGGYLCKDIVMKIFGRTFDWAKPEDWEALRKEKPTEKCSQVTVNAAGWTVEVILETELS